MFLSPGSLVRSMTSESRRCGVFAVLYPVFHGSSICVSQYSSAQQSSEANRKQMLCYVGQSQSVSWWLGPLEEVNGTLRDELRRST